MPQAMTASMRRRIRAPPIKFSGTVSSIDGGLAYAFDVRVSVVSCLRIRITSSKVYFGVRVQYAFLYSRYICISVVSSAAAASDAGAKANGGAEASTPTEEKAFDVKAAAVAASTSSAPVSPGSASDTDARTPDPADLERIISLAESLQTRRRDVAAPRLSAPDDGHEMSDEEQFELARRMRRMDVSGQPVAVDMEIIRPYKNLLYHGGAPSLPTPDLQYSTQIATDVTVRHRILVYLSIVSTIANYVLYS